MMGSNSHFNFIFSFFQKWNSLVSCHECGRHVCVCVCDQPPVFNSLQPHGLGPPGYSVHGIFQARILVWVVISYSR